MSYEMIFRSCCAGSGYRWVWPHDALVGTGPTVFRCDCGLGRAKLSTGIPLWDDSRHGVRYTALQPQAPAEPLPTSLPPLREAPSAPTPAVDDPLKTQSSSLSAFTIEEIEILKTVKLTRDVESREFRDIVARHGKPAVVHAMRAI